MDESKPLTTEIDALIVDRWAMCMAEAGYPKTILQTTQPEAYFEYLPATTTVEELRALSQASRLLGYCNLHGCQTVEEHMQRWRELNWWSPLAQVSESR